MFYAIFLILASVTPWLLGGNYPLVRTVLLAATTLSLGGAIVQSIYRNGLTGRKKRRPLSENGTSLTRSRLIKRPLSWLMIVPILIGTGYCAVQAFSVNLGWSELSAYGAESRSRLCELLLGVGVFLVSIAACRFKNPAWLFGVVALNGFALAAFGIIQRMTWNGKLYWTYELVHGGLPFASFVNRNNAGGYLLICLAAGCYFLARQVFLSNPTAQTSSFDQSSMILRIARRLVRAFADLNTAQLYIYFGVIVIALGIILTLSRGAAVAMLIAILVSWVFLVRHNWLSLVTLFFFVVAGIGLSVWVDQHQLFTERVQTLSDVSEAAAPRWNHWSTSWQYAQDYWLLGSGAGTYRYMYPPFQESKFYAWFYHAENQYLETLAELGILGLSCLLLTLLSGVWISLRLVGRSNSQCRAIGIVGLMCLAGQTVCSAFDFGLFQPANTVLMASVMGAVVARYEMVGPESDSQSSRRFVSLATYAVYLSFIPVLGWATYEYSAVDARFSVQRVVDRYAPSQGQDVLRQAHQRLDYARRIRPDDFMIDYLEGQILTLEYRLNTSKNLLELLSESVEVSQSTPNLVGTKSQLAGEPSKGMPAHSNPSSTPSSTPSLGPITPTSPTSLDDAWKLTSLPALHRLVRRTQLVGTPDDLRQLLSEPEIEKYLRPAWQAYQRAESKCRLWSRTAYQLAEFSAIMEPNRGSEYEREMIEEALRRCPSDPQLLYYAGLLAQNSGNKDMCSKYWRKSLSFSREFEEAIIQFCRAEVSMRQFFNEILPHDPMELLRIAKRYFNAPEDKLLQQFLLGHTARVAHELDDESSGEFAFVQGEIHRLLGQPDLAAVHYRKSLKLNPENIPWRIAYIESLLAFGNYDEAITEIKVCQLYHGPHHLRVERLLRRARRDQRQALRNSRSTLARE